MGRFAILALLLLRAAEGQSAAGREAVSLMQRGDFASAEKLLRNELSAHPTDWWVSSLLGVALDNEKRIPEAEEFHRRAVAGLPGSAEILTNFGVHYWSAGRYPEAEGQFEKALAIAPTFFTALFDLGVMATYNGRYERARQALTAALEMRPQSVDVLYRLAGVDEASHEWESAVMHLAQAAKLDPHRADVQKLLAISATELGALDDAAAAWDRYLTLEPNDETARRERAYVWANSGKAERAIADLKSYAQRHPDDPVGHYELGQAQRAADPASALESLDRAVALKPDYALALSARGAIHYQEGKPELALPDLEHAASLQPGDAGNLDRLGQAYLSVERPADAVRTLRRATELAPQDSKTLLHYARALADSGATAESKQAMDRFRQMGPDTSKSVPAGLVDYLSESPEQRRAEFRARVEKAVRDHPEDPKAQLEHLKILLEEGKAGDIAATAARVGTLQADPITLAQAGHALLAAGYFAPAAALLQHAAPDSGVTLDLALATLHAKGGTVRATEVESALREAGGPPDAYLRETALLVKQGNVQEALGLAEAGARAHADERALQLMKATTLDRAGKVDEADRLLVQIQSRWPEWSAARVARGILLDVHQHYDEARQALETATALGARGAETPYYLADCLLHSGHADDAEKVIAPALPAASDDPWIQLLAARIAFARGMYPLAAERSRAAIRLRPNWIAAHEQLAEADRKLGKTPEASAESSRAASLPKDSRSDIPPYLEALYEAKWMR